MEEVLPNDLGYLPSLERLDLSRNNFITMPACLIRLFGLRSLEIEYYKCLQSLPELPSSIESLNAHSCKSLETFPCSSSAYTSKLLGDVRFNFSNCFRLGEIQGSDFVAAIIEGIQLMSSIPKFSPDWVCVWLRIIQDKMIIVLYMTKFPYQVDGIGFLCCSQLQGYSFV